MEAGSITRLLSEVSAGVPGAEDRLFARVYEELRAMASDRMAAERERAAEGSAGDLVHDAYARLHGEPLENRRHLFFAYARAMRQILVERARRRHTARRGGDRERAALPADLADSRPSVHDDAAEVAEMLEKLRRESERAADVAELRFFGGLAMGDIARALGVSERTADGDWRFARERIAQWIRD